MAAPVYQDWPNTVAVGEKDSPFIKMSRRKGSSKNNGEKVKNVTSAKQLWHCDSHNLFGGNLYVTQPFIIFYLADLG